MLFVFLFSFRHLFLCFLLFFTFLPPPPSTFLSFYYCIPSFVWLVSYFLLHFPPFFASLYLHLSLYPSSVNLIFSFSVSVILWLLFAFIFTFRHLFLCFLLFVTFSPLPHFFLFITAFLRLFGWFLLSLLFTSLSLYPPSVSSVFYSFLSFYDILSVIFLFCSPCCVVVSLCYLFISLSHLLAFYCQ